jgi:hypothetical protein
MILILMYISSGMLKRGNIMNIIETKSTKKPDIIIKVKSNDPENKEVEQVDKEKSVRKVKLHKMMSVNEIYGNIRKTNG